MTSSAPQNFFQRRRLLGMMLLFGVGLVAGSVVWHGKSADALAVGRDRIAREESEQRAEIAARLRSFGAEERKNLAHVALSSAAIEGLLATAVDGLSLTEAKSGARVTFEKIHANFAPGFPRLTVDARAEIGAVAADFRVTAALRHRLGEDHQIRLRLVVLSIDPMNSLPTALKTVISAEATERLNERMPEFTVPLPRQFDFAPAAQAVSDFWVPTPNGRVLLGLTLPPLPAASLRWEPVAVYWDVDGFHALARLSSGELPPAILSPAKGGAPTDQELQELFTPWRLVAGRGYAARVPARLLLGYLERLNALPSSARTVTVQGKRTEGHILDKTGGLPFGNGFQSWIEGPERLQINATLGDLRPHWRDGRGLALAGTVLASGRVQIHVHGNAARIKKRVNIGPFSWKVIDVAVGGGVGTSVGASANAGPGDVAASITYLDKEKVFAVRLDSPAQIRANVDIGGVPDDLEKWLKAGFDVPLPAGRDLYRFQVPAVIASSFELKMPGGGTAEKKVIPLRVELGGVKFTADALEFDGGLATAPAS